MNIALTLETERLFHQVEVRICVEKNRTRLKCATRYQNIRGGYDKASTPKFESVFASPSPKLVVSFKALQVIKEDRFTSGQGNCFSFRRSPCRRSLRVMSLPRTVALARSQSNVSHAIGLRRHRCPEAFDLRSRKPFKIELNHQKGFQLIAIVFAHPHNP